jgi:hypothetical protein
MPLLTPKLTVELAKAFTDMQPTIQAALLGHFANPVPPHTAAGVNDDDPDPDKRRGGILENVTKSIYSVNEAIDKWTVENPPGNMDTKEKRAAYKNELWTIIAKEWADSLSTHISTDITTIMATQLAPVLANIIDSHLREASLSVIIPPGTVSYGVGAAVTLNPFPIELLVVPGPIPGPLEAAIIKVPTFGGIK